MNEKYSVLMAVYAKEKAEFLKASVESMLAQTIPPDDFVIVCDGQLTLELELAIDDFINQVQGLFKIVRLARNQGLGNALNVGIRYCKNELIARMDSDDISLPERCRMQLWEFEKDKELTLCGGYIAEFCRDAEYITDIRRVPCDYDIIKRYAKKRNPINHMSVMFKKSAVKQAGGYQSMFLAEDYFLWVRMLHMNMKLKNIPAILVYARIGNGMYKRRGGKDYARHMCRFQLKILRLKFINPFEFICNCSLRLLVSLLPQKGRAFFYHKLLRGPYMEIKIRKSDDAMGGS